MCFNVMGNLTTNKMQGEVGSSSIRMQTAGQLSALIVDDDAVVRMLHKTLLNSFGITTQEAQNGKEAVNLFNSGAKFDLVLIDRDMPVMNGIEATKELRAMGVSCKIVGVTSCETNEEEEEFVQAGLDLFRVKPLTGAKIAPFIEQLRE